MVPAKPMSSCSVGDVEDEEESRGAEKEGQAVAMTREDKLRERYLKGIKKRKCGTCGNTARSRCPFRVCKSCCVNARNNCSVHVYRNLGGQNGTSQTQAQGVVSPTAMVQSPVGCLPFSSTTETLLSGLPKNPFSGSAAVPGGAAGVSSSAPNPFRADQRAWLHTNGIAKMGSAVQMNVFSPGVGVQPSLTPPGSRPGTPAGSQAGFQIGGLPMTPMTVGAGASAKPLTSPGALSDSMGVQLQRLALGQEANPIVNIMAPWMMHGKPAPTPEQQYLLRLKSLRAIVQAYQKESSLTHAWRIQKLWELEEAELEMEEEALNRYVRNSVMLAELFSGDADYPSLSSSHELNGRESGFRIDRSFQSLSRMVKSQGLGGGTEQLGGMKRGRWVGPKAIEDADAHTADSPKEILHRLLREIRATERIDENREDRDGSGTLLSVRRKRHRKLLGGSGTAKRVDTLDLLLDQADRVTTNEDVEACELAYQEEYGWRPLLPWLPEVRPEDDRDKDTNSEADPGGCVDGTKNIHENGNEGEWSPSSKLGEGKKGDEPSVGGNQTENGWPILSRSWWPVHLGNPRAKAVCRQIADSVTDLLRL